jgi:hypothetical protein
MSAIVQPKAHAVRTRHRDEALAWHHARLPPHHSSDWEDKEGI